MHTLTFNLGNSHESRAVELDDGDHAIGRSKDCRIVISDGSVSRHHCLLLVHRAEVIVRDCGSHNGTFIDGVRVNGQRQWKPGQVLRLGTVEAQLSFLRDAGWRDDDDSCESAVVEQRRFEKCKATLPLPGMPVVLSSNVVIPDETIVQQSGDFEKIRIEPLPAATGGVPKRCATPGMDLGLWLWFVNFVVVVIVAALLVWLWRSS